MKYLFFTLILAATVIPAPTKDEIAKAKKIVAMDFSIRDLMPLQTWPDQKYYEPADGTKVWAFNNGYIIVRLNDGTEVHVQPGGMAMQVTFTGGKSFTWDKKSGQIHWGLMMEAAPDFELNVMGKPKDKTKLSDLKGKVVLIDFWASWCGPCMRYLPETEKLHKTYKDKGLVVLGVNIEGDDMRAKLTAGKLGLTFPTLMAEAGPDGYNWGAKQIRDYQVTGIPAAVIIDKKGLIRYIGTVVQDHKIIDKLLTE